MTEILSELREGVHHLEFYLHLFMSLVIPLTIGAAVLLWGIWVIVKERRVRHDQQ